MTVPDAFLPREAENARLTAYRAFDTQLQSYAKDARAADRGRRLLARYNKYPWLSPGIATSYTKWEEQFGRTAARQLATTAFSAGQAPDATNKTVNQSLEDFIATKDFQRQVKAFKDSQSSDQGWFGDILDATPVVGAVKGIAQGESVGEIGLRAVPGAKLATDIDKAVIEGAGEIPGVGPSIKGVSRTAFTALESPYQEVQGAGSKIITGALGALGASVQGHSPTDVASGNQPLRAAISSQGGAQTAALQNLNIQTGTYPNAAGLFGGVSSGAIALDKLLSGENVDLGTGYLPGGEVEAQHTRAVQNIAALRYGGQLHYGTPGRLFAATVTEPGTKPFNALSGLVDAASIIKLDPVNYALTAGSDLLHARQGFATANELSEAGAFKSWVRSFIDPPTVDQYLASRKGQAVAEQLATIGPDRLTELLRRTNWSWDIPTYTAVAQAKTADEVRDALRPALGTTIDRQPALNSFAANIRNTTGSHALLSEIPGVRLNISEQGLGGPNGSLKALYNHALGLGLDDATISHHLYDVASAAGKVERSEGLIRYMEMERAGLEALGIPANIARDQTRFALTDLAGNARTYFDTQLARGESTPGLILDGTATMTDKPYLLSEHLGDNIFLSPLQGKGGRNEALTQYGRLLGIYGTGATDEALGRFGGALEKTGDIGRTIYHAAWRSNAALTSLQNRLWKPLALLRGAWMVRVLGEEQIRLGMAGYDAMWDHPIRYFSWLAASKEGEVPNLIDWAAEQRGLRGSQAGAFGLVDPNQSAYGRIIARNTRTFLPDETGHAAVWADKLTRYSEDPLMSTVAKAVADHEGPVLRGAPMEVVTGSPRVSPLDDIKDQFWAGNLTRYRADLSKDPNFLANGIDLSTREGADAYIDGLYDRLHYYTSGDGNLINTVANGTYLPDLNQIATRRSLKGLHVTIDGEPAEVVSHNRGTKTAHVLFEDGRDEDVAVSHLTLHDDQAVKILTKNRDNIAVDKNFVNHLVAQDETLKPAEVTGTQAVRDNDHRDQFVNWLFANMMDRPTSYLNRSQVFIQGYFDQIERLLPWMTPEARTEALANARDALQSGGTVARHALQPRYNALVDAAAKSGPGTLTHTEADFIARGKALDNMRDLLYDTHRKNRGLAAIQLIVPFGEAWKEMLGSWARIAVEKPQTVRKFQVAIDAARGANPFDLLPGAVPSAYQGRGFFYNDPNSNGADTFVYPWSASLNEALIGVPIPFTAQGQNLSMGFNLTPGVGPVFQMPAMYALNTFMSDPKWDPIRHLISPYGTNDISGGIIEQAFLPAYLKKWLIANPFTNPDASADSQSARALNSTIADIMKYRASTGEADLNSRAGIAAAYKSASADARWLYIMQGTFQFGAPAAPRAEFLAQTKNHNLVKFSILRDAYYKLQQADPSTATSKFIERFGEKAIYATAPKTLGDTFAEQFTKTAVNWERRNPDLATKYPLSFALFAPTKKNEPFSYDAYAQAIGQRSNLTAKDAILRTNNILGSMWYDRLRSNLGLKPGQSGNTATQAYLAEKRLEIHKAYPGWREIATDDSRIPRAIEELSSASHDPVIIKSNPRLARAVRDYIAQRDWALGVVKEAGGGGDFQRPGYASGDKWAPLREYLRSQATAIAAKVPAFMPLWEDSFAREMVSD